jgi:hypothetical protein
MNGSTAPHPIRLQGVQLNNASHPRHALCSIEAEHFSSITRLIGSRPPGSTLLFNQIWEFAEWMNDYQLLRLYHQFGVK